MQGNIGKMIYPFSHSALPAWSLSALFFGSSMVRLSNPASLPPFAVRFGFGFIFGGAGYVLSTGDLKNGSGIATAWSGIYLLGNQLRQVDIFKRDSASRAGARLRHPLSLALTGATLLSTAVYGGEYFWFQNFDGENK